MLIHASHIGYFVSLPVNELKIPGKSAVIAILLGTIDDH